jgi:hypothetical protein
MAVKCTPAVLLPWPLDVPPDHGNYWRPEGNVGHEVAVHDVDVQPVSAMADCARAFGA